MKNLPLTRRITRSPVLIYGRRRAGRLPAKHLLPKDTPLVKSSAREIILRAKLNKRPPDNRANKKAALICRRLI